MSNSKYWCITVNNYTEADEERIIGQCNDRTLLGYGVFGRETGEGGTRHLQGYVEFLNRKRRPGVSRLFPRAHIEARKGTPLEASTYCKKDGDYFESGTLSTGQGARSDLVAVRDRVRSGASELEIAEEHFGIWCQYGRQLREYRGLLRPPVMRPELSVYFVWGTAGAGKTRIARDIALGRGRVWISSDPTLSWFDGYDGEESVILDDYRGGAPDSTILRLLDIYEHRVPIKGSFVSWNPRYIFLTSNADPRTLHSDVSEAFMRRIRKVIHFTCTLDFNDEAEVSRIKAYFN